MAVGGGVNWQSYEEYVPRVPGLPQDMSRVEARKAFEHFLASRPTRIAVLRRLLADNGIELDTSDGGIQRLNDWFYDSVEADPDRPGYLLPIWYSVVFDIAMFLGAAMIERHPNLRWEFFTWGKKNIAYQQPAIMGYATEDPKFHTNSNLVRGVATYGHRIVAAQGSTQTLGVVVVRGTPIDVDAIDASHRATEVERDAFVAWMHVAARRNGQP